MLLPAALRCLCVTLVAAPADAAFTRLRDVDVQVPAVEVVAVKSSDGGLALLLRGHLDEAEAARAARVAVFDDRRRLDRAGLREMLAEIFARSLVREITDVKFHGHVCVPLLYFPVPGITCWSAGQCPTGIRWKRVLPSTFSQEMSST